MTLTSYLKYEDKLKDKSDYHACKMSLELTLEENETMDYVKGRVVEPPSNASAGAQRKYKKGKVKAKKIIVDLPSLVDTPTHILPIESGTHGKYLSSVQ